MTSTYASEEQVERAAERMMDALDRWLMSHDPTQQEYEDEVRKLDAWTEAQRKRLTRGGR